LLGIWFDVPQRFDRARGERVIRFARSLQPNLVINNRTGAPGDFDTPEQAIGRAQFDRPWESCITLGSQWSWKPDDKLKSHEYAIQILVACAVGDGNLALNTNPMPDGRIEPRQIERFRKIGQWLEQYGESIYETRGGPFVASGGGTTRRMGDVSLPAGMAGIPSGGAAVPAATTSSTCTSSAGPATCSRCPQSNRASSGTAC
jgi:alpha-L-fucosidase